MRLETRIVKVADRKDTETELSWKVEWRNNSTDNWHKYAECTSVAEAVEIRKICKENSGRYPVIYETRNGMRKYKVTRDFTFHQESYNIYYKLPFGKWLFHHLKYDKATAIEQCNELAERKGPDNAPRTGLSKYPYKIVHTIESCVLCIKYPFLYPRNRWNGKHYTNWDLDKKIDRLFDESHECTNPVEFHKGMTEEELYQMQHPKYRITCFPKAAKCRFLKIYRGILEVLHCIPTYTEMDAMDYGWRKAFGKELLNEVKRELKKKGLLRRYRIMQIKEKWGELCWYDNGGTDELFKILRKYEGMSYSTCINCGKPAKYRTTGYILPYCERCMSKEYLDSGTYTILGTDDGWKEVNTEESKK